MRLAILLLTAFGLSACSGGPKVYSAVAPAGALSCALRQASALGYQPTAGGVGDGYIRFVRASPYRAADAGKEAAARIASFGVKGNNRLEQDHLTVTEAGGTLRVQAVGLYENGRAGKPSGEADGHAQSILAGCATPSDSLR